MPQAGPAFSNYPAVLGCPDLLLKKRKKNKTVAGITQDQHKIHTQLTVCSLCMFSSGVSSFFVLALQGGP